MDTSSSPQLPPRDGDTWRSKVVWSEGMYLRPQHFQQLERYLEHLVQLRCRAVGGAYWGFFRIELDQEALAIGKLALSMAQGIMPDGTPFHFASRDEAPEALPIPVGTQSALVVLALPLRRAGGEDCIFEERRDSLARYGVQVREIADVNSVALGPASLQLGRPRFRLALAEELGHDWQALGLVRVQETRGDHQLVLDRLYIPPMLAAAEHEVLRGFMHELHGLLEQRGQLLARRLSQPGRGGVAEIADFLLLGLVNRAQADTWQALQQEQLHPQSLFLQWLRMACDLATYTARERRPQIWPVYRHDDMQSSFSPLMDELRRSLSTMLEQNAVAIELEERAPRVWVARIPSLELLRNAGFVLAVHAEAPAEVVRSRFPAQVKLGPVEQLHDLVHLHLPGIGVRSLPVAPRQIPYHAGHHYFELDTQSELWGQLSPSGGLALHVAGDLPGLKMACWAIRG